MLEVKAVDWGSNRWGQVALDDVARLGRVDNLKFFLVGFRNRLFIFDFSRSGTAGLELDTREFLSDWREFLVVKLKYSRACSCAWTQISFWNWRYSGVSLQHANAFYS